MFEVKKEITGKRDMALMKLHRERGFYYSDLSFISCGYNLGQPKIIEVYIRKQDWELALNTPYIRSLISFSKRHLLPLLLVGYDLIFKAFNIYLVRFNKPDLIKNNITEKSLVNGLYRLKDSKWKDEDDKKAFLNFINTNQQNIDQPEKFPHEFMSRRHRRYGYNCPFNDLDFILLDELESIKAFIEYKSSNYEISYYVLKMYRLLGDIFQVPMFKVIHKTDLDDVVYSIYPLNSIAENIISENKYIINNAQRYFEREQATTLSFKNDHYFQFLDKIKSAKTLLP